MSKDPFDPGDGEAGKRDGMARAAAGANPEWWAFMIAAGIEVARGKPRFITDDLERIRVERQGPRTPENRAMGPLMLELCRREVCVSTWDWVPSQQRFNHSRPMRIWHSLIYRGAPIPRPKRRRIIDPRQLELLPEEA